MNKSWKVTFSTRPISVGFLAGCSDSHLSTFVSCSAPHINIIFAVDYPPVDELVAQCAKMKLLDRLLIQMKERGHKVPSTIHGLTWFEPHGFSTVSGLMEDPHNIIL
jgi:hypothetical protein